MTDIANTTATTAVFEGTDSFQTYSGAFETYGDVDWIKVTLKSGTYSFFASAEAPGPDNGDSKMRLFDASGNVVAASDDEGAGPNSYLHYSVSTPETFFVEVTDFNHNPGLYSVSVANFVSATPDFHTDADDIFTSSKSEIIGGRGDDTITMTSNCVVALGEQGDDYITGEYDVLGYWMSGGLGNDTLHGNDGPDRFAGDCGFDAIYGGAGADRIYGGADSDTLDGGAGDDAIYTGSGADVALGGVGDDIFHVDDAADQALEYAAGAPIPSPRP